MTDQSDALLAAIASSSNTKTNFKALIRRRIVSLGMNQTKYAIHLGISNSYLSEIINGKKPLPREMKKDLALAPVEQNEGYNPDRLLDEIKDKLNTRLDFRLAMALGVSANAISKIRMQKFSISSTLVLKIYFLTGWQIEEILLLAGCRKEDIF